jgi:hypothetical protein
LEYLKSSMYGFSVFVKINIEELYIEILLLFFFFYFSIFLLFLL